MTNQSAKIAQLTAEVDTLKTALSGGGGGVGRRREDEKEDEEEEEEEQVDNGSSSKENRTTQSVSEREKDARIAVLEEQLANLRGS